MTLWSAAATLLLFQTPAQTVRSEAATLKSSENEKQVAVRIVPHVAAAVGPESLLTHLEFRALWQALFGFFPDDPTCGLPRKITGSDSQMVNEDGFLALERGFLPALCAAESWFVASARIDPCRLRLGAANRTRADIDACSLSGKFTEIRFVLQPAVKHDRGFFFPDAALHVAFSLNDPEQAIRLWQKSRIKQTSQKNALAVPEFLKEVRRLSKPNDVSLFLSTPGLDRWTFARAVYRDGVWVKDKLAHGGFHESLSDADLEKSVVRTELPAHMNRLSPEEHLDPLKVNPLQGGCFACHMAQTDRPVRLFRHFGWGLAGEPIVSQRVRAEAEFAAREVPFLLQRVRKK